MTIVVMILIMGTLIYRTGDSLTIILWAFYFENFFKFLNQKIAFFPTYIVGGVFMIKAINLVEKEETINTLQLIRDGKKVSRYIRIINSHIKELNKIIGRNVFKKDAVYINSLTLWEIMQPVGGQGSHHYHGLAPEEVYNALSRIQYSKNVITTDEDRLIVISDVEIKEGLFLLVIIARDQNLYKERLDNVAVIITIYPSNRKNIMVYKK